MNEDDRFRLALSQIIGKRLTYGHLTGRDRDMSMAAINSAEKDRLRLQSIAFLFVRLIPTYRRAPSYYFGYLQCTARGCWRQETCTTG
jgi:hypothetical protein